MVGCGKFFKTRLVQFCLCILTSRFDEFKSDTNSKGSKNAWTTTLAHHKQQRKSEKNRFWSWVYFSSVSLLLIFARRSHFNCSIALAAIEFLWLFKRRCHQHYISYQKCMNSNMILIGKSLEKLTKNTTMVFTTVSNKTPTNIFRPTQWVYFVQSTLEK